MRVDRARLITLALAVLECARGRLHGGMFKPGADVRMALAVLYSFSRSGDRKLYDGFWANLSDPYAKAYSDVAGTSWRMSEAHRMYEGIVTDVDAPAHIEYRSKVSALATPQRSEPIPP